MSLIHSLTIRINALTPTGRKRNRDAKAAALRGGMYPAYLGGSLTARAYGLDPAAAVIQAIN